MSFQAKQIPGDLKMARDFSLLGNYDTALVYVGVSLALKLANNDGLKPPPPPLLRCRYYEGVVAALKRQLIESMGETKERWNAVSAQLANTGLLWV